MADTYLNYMGKLIKLKDNGDGTYSVATSAIVNELDITLSSLRDAIAGVGGNAKSLYNLFELLSEIHVPEIESPATYAKRTMSLSANPEPMQQFSFGDGVTSVEFEYVAILEGYAGFKIPVLVGADAAETQANTILAYEGFNGQKPLVTVQAVENSFVVTASVPGPIQLTLVAPANVGTDGGLVPGQIAIDMRALSIALNSLFTELVALNGKIAAMSVEPSADSFEQIAVAAAVVPLTAPPVGVVKALISVETAGIRWRIDGADPTAAVGQPALKDDVIVLSNPADIANFKAIRSSATSATLSVTYFK